VGGYFWPFTGVLRKIWPGVTSKNGLAGLNRYRVEVEKPRMTRMSRIEGRRLLAETIFPRRRSWLAASPTTDHDRTEGHKDSEALRSFGRDSIVCFLRCLLLEKNVFGESPKPSRRGACSPDSDDLIRVIRVIRGAVYFGAREATIFSKRDSAHKGFQIGSSLKSAGLTSPGKFAIADVISLRISA
jgi:hypothetical protein